MSIPSRWRKEEGLRIRGSRPLDRLKVQGPGAIRTPQGGYRLYYTAVGPGKPFPDCQGYILSALSEDGVNFEPDSGIRLAPRPDFPYMSLRVLVPSPTRCNDGRWRIYFESRGPADRPVVVCSAVSDDMLDWELEDGIRLEHENDVRGPRYVSPSPTEAAGCTAPA